jgi:hypothetical protein
MFKNIILSIGYDGQGVGLSWALVGDKTKTLGSLRFAETRRGIDGGGG